MDTQERQQYEKQEEVMAKEVVWAHDYNLCSNAVVIQEALTVV